MILNNIIGINKNIRNAKDIKKRLPSRKTPIDSYSKLKAKTIKN